MFLRNNSTVPYGTFEKNNLSNILTFSFFASFHLLVWFKVDGIMEESQTKNESELEDGIKKVSEERNELEEKVLALLPDLKEELGEASSGVSDATLCKYLYWKQDVKRASERFLSFVEWRKDNPLIYDDVPLKISADPMLEKMLGSDIVISPESLVSKEEGSTVLLFRLRNNDRSDGRTAENICRMVFYMMDRVLERPRTLHNGVVVVHDMNHLSRANMDRRVVKILPKALFGHLPIAIKAVYILNAPTFFKVIFTMISKLAFSSKMKDRIHFITNLEELHEKVDRDLLLVEHGGKLEFCSQQWTEEQKQRELQEECTMESLTDCIPTSKF